MGINWNQYDKPRTETEKKHILGMIEDNAFLQICCECGAVCGSDIEEQYPATKSGFYEYDNDEYCEDCYALLMVAEKESFEKED